MKKQSISAAQQFSEERFTKIDIIKQKNSAVFLLNFLAGQIMKSHSHPNRELYLHVLKGYGTLLMDGEEVPVKEGDIIFCAPDEQIGFNNTSNSKVTFYGTLTKIMK